MNSVIEDTTVCKLRGLHCPVVCECRANTSRLLNSILGGCLNLTPEEFIVRINADKCEIGEFFHLGCSSVGEIEMVDKCLRSAFGFISNFQFLCSQFGTNKFPPYQIMIFQSIVSYISMSQILQIIRSGKITPALALNALKTSLEDDNAFTDMIGILKAVNPEQIPSMDSGL